jgi:TPR repeat protein
MKRIVILNMLFIFALFARGAFGNNQKIVPASGFCFDKAQIAALEKKADEDNLFAIRDLGEYYGTCVGNRDKVLEYGKKAAKIGTANDVYGYGVLLESYENPKQAFPWFLKAAEMGDSKAKLHVAEAYLDGKYVTKDSEKALMWFQLGATCQESGITDMENLAKVLWEQKPVPLSGPKALAWLIVVNKQFGLYLDVKKSYDEMRNALSTDQIAMANKLADEYEYESGCKKLESQ